MTRRRITSDFVAGRSMPLLLLILLATAAASRADSTTPKDTDDDDDDSYSDEDGDGYMYDNDEDNFGNSVNYTNYYRGRGSDVYGKFREYYDNNNNNYRRGNNFYNRGNNYYGNNNKYPGGGNNYPGGGNNYPGGGNNYPGGGHNYPGGNDYNPPPGNRNPRNNEVDENRIPDRRKNHYRAGDNRTPVIRKRKIPVKDDDTVKDDNKVKDDNRVKDDDTVKDDNDDKQVDTKESSTYNPPKDASTYFKNISEVRPSSREFLADVYRQRRKFNTITNYVFNDNRTRILSSVNEVPEWTKGVIYWMYRDQRVQDNWAMIKAQQLALKNKVPLHVVYCRSLKISNSTVRQYRIMVKGLLTVQADCKKLNIEFHYAHGYAIDVIPEFVDKHKVGAIVVDFMPLRDHTHWIKQLVNCTGSRVPIIQVDAHNVVPCWMAASQKVTNSSEMRSILGNQNRTYLTEFPTVVRHPYSGNLKARPIDWAEADRNLIIHNSVLPIPIVKAGYTAGMSTLHRFIKKRLQNYHENRKNPLKNGLSNLSPWLHFGHISAQRVILEVYKYARSSPENVAAFMKEVFIRRELSDNFCFYVPNYDKLEGAPTWGRNTLNEHRNDFRKYMYTRYRLERGLTHNDLFNAAQLQLVKEGKMHRFLRMYWGKKIVEWSRTPESAITNANEINNKYSIDGRDPNGYVGVLWAVAGLHDRPWKDRPVGGVVRFLSYQRLHMNFDTRKFVKQYGARVYGYKFRRFRKPITVLPDTQKQTLNHMQNHTMLI